MLASIFRLIVVLGLIASSCVVRAEDCNTQIKSAPPMLDLSTPESALNSYWSLNTWESKTLELELSRQQENRLESAKSLRIKLSTGEVNQYFTNLAEYPDEVFNRTIKNVLYESANRSILLVNIKNVTPIPEGAIPSKYQEQERMEGVNFKYIFIKESTEWKLAEVWRIQGGLYPLDQMLFKGSNPIYPSNVFSY